MDGKPIVKNIKKFHINTKMSLQRLAKLPCLATRYVCKNERFDKVPHFSTLIKITNAFNMDISLLMAEYAEVPENVTPSIVREKERKGRFSKGTLYGYHCEALAHKRLGRIWNPISSLMRKGSSPARKKNSCTFLKECMSLWMMAGNTY
jgi:transcriptional regulator with XRE-family HTH domain